MSASQSFVHHSKRAGSILLGDHAFSLLCTKRENELPAVSWLSGCFLSCFGLVGEPINKEAWQWFYQVVGEGRYTLVDTWWQTGKRQLWGAWGTLTIDKLLVGREGLTHFSLIQQVCQKNPPGIWISFGKSLGSFCT